jgi:hypothetical protein
MDLKHTIDKKGDDYLYEKMKRFLIINLNKDCQLALQGKAYMKKGIRKILVENPLSSESYKVISVFNYIIAEQFTFQSLIEVYKYKKYSTAIMPELYELLLHPEDCLKEYIISKNKYLIENATTNAVMFDACIDRLLEELERILLDFDQSIAAKKLECVEFTSQIMSIYESPFSSKEKLMMICRLVCGVTNSISISYKNNVIDTTSNTCNVSRADENENKTDKLLEKNVSSTDENENKTDKLLEKNVSSTDENENKTDKLLEEEDHDNYNEYYVKVKCYLISRLNLSYERKLKALKYLREDIANILKSYDEDEDESMSFVCSRLKSYIIIHQYISESSSSLLDIYHKKSHIGRTATWILMLLLCPETETKRFVEKVLNLNVDSDPVSKQIIDECSKKLLLELPSILHILDEKIADKNNECKQILAKITNLIQIYRNGNDLYRKLHNEINGFAS